MIRTGAVAVAVAVVAVGMLGSLSVGFAEVEPETEPEPAPAPAPVIESIHILIRDVFEDEDGTPDLWPYRFANQLHLDTKERVIRRELLFHEGDRLDRETVEQTERNLRALPFLRSARVEMIPGETEGGIGIRVVVADSWSTTPEARLAKIGNEWIWGFGLTEENLFGLGKELRAMHAVDLDREETFVAYRDPRLLGTRTSLATSYSFATDGHLASIAAERPFFALDTLWSFRAGVEDFDRLDPLYEEGERVEDLRHLRKRAEMDAARALRRSGSSALRLHFGYQFSRDDVDLDRRQFGVLRVGVTAVSHRYRALTHLNRFERTEDVNLGNEASAFIGFSSPLLGGEPGLPTFVSLTGRRGLAWSESGFLLGTASWQARDRRGGLENSLARARIDVVQKLSPRRLLLAKADFTYGANLDPEVQLRLGAESGLRGYPVRQFNGNRSLLLSAEGRWFLADDVARLVSFGVACFLDSGYAWPEGAPIALRDLRSDVGVSLLLGANRVAANRPGVRIDLAYALNPLEGRSPWLVSAGSQIGF
jgi:hemolysin activation/secretion protein